VTPVIGVAGQLYDHAHALLLDEALKNLYDVYEVPLFHAAPCPARSHPFDHLERPLRDNFHNRMIEHIHSYAKFGVARCVPLDAYEETFGVAPPRLQRL
jgi:hypothetical protein